MAHIEINRIESVLSFAREAIVASQGHAIPYRMAMTAGLAFCQHHRRAFGIWRHRSRWRNIGYPIEQQITLCEDLGHHATSLRSSTRQGLGAWIASTPFQTALFTANTSARGSCLDIDYCTISPCSAMSRPSRSMSCVTRRPTTFLTTKRMIKLATAS